MDDIVERLRVGRFPIELRMMYEAADEIERLRGYILELGYASDADWDGNPIPIEDQIQDAVFQIRHDHKSWKDACDTIRAGKDWPQGTWPSMVDRWVVAGAKVVLDEYRETVRVLGAWARSHGFEDANSGADPDCGDPDCDECKALRATEDVLANPIASAAMEKGGAG